MKNIFSCSKSRGYKYQLEIIETEISDWHSNNHLPRHISLPETQSHRGTVNVGKIVGKTNYIPRACQTDVGNQNQTAIQTKIARYSLKCFNCV
ncbi:MAG: hypothetical protein ACFCAD_19945 [Pleurocapsa sp.]